jgi:hypothetical protein
MTTYCKLVNFPKIAKDILTNDKNIINLNMTQSFGSKLVLPEYFSKDFNEWLGDTLNLVVELSEIFYMKPNVKYPIHTDGHNYPNQKAKLNFVMGGAVSRMCWYEPIHPKNLDLTKFVDASKQAAYLHIDPDNAHELHSAELTNFCIVDAGTFHTVKNADELRIAWNLILADCNTKQRMLFPDLQQRLSEYVLD